MEWRDRSGNPVPGDDGQSRALSFLYGTGVGRCLLTLLVKPWVSKAAGKFLNTGISRIWINPFIRRANIRMEDFEDRAYTSFNDFFTRRVREGTRPVDMEPTHLIAPCDSKLTVYPITTDSRFHVKNTEYTMAELLKDESLAKHYEGGTLLLFRLTVEDYHRYCYVDGGKKGETIHIPGVFYTVNPIANERYQIYQENTREYTILESDHFGTVLTMEVGATLVGRIVNKHGQGYVSRGEEKGRFEFGGSTIILCFEKNRITLDSDLIENTRQGVETVVKLGEKIGCAAKEPVRIES